MPVSADNGCRHDLNRGIGVVDRALGVEGHERVRAGWVGFDSSLSSSASASASVSAAAAGSTPTLAPTTAVMARRARQSVIRMFEAVAGRKKLETGGGGRRREKRQACAAVTLGARR